MSTIVPVADGPTVNLAGKAAKLFDVRRGFVAPVEIHKADTVLIPFRGRSLIPETGGSDSFLMHKCEMGKIEQVVGD